MTNRAIKYRLYPTDEQAVMFAKTFGCCRKVWNLMLSDKIEYYEKTGKALANTPAQYKKEYPYLKEVDSLALANVQLNLQQAYKNFFKNKKTGFPKFKSKRKTKRSYTTTNQKGTVAIADNGIRLPKIGVVRAVIHRQPDKDWKLKSATISQNSDGSYYASLLFEFEMETSSVSKMSEKAIGLDYKSNGLYMDSNGNIGTNHRYFRQSEKKLARAQRKLKHKTVGSSNYKKQQRKINRIYRHVANQRLDNLHKISTEIANQYDIICVENLDMTALANKKYKNGKSTLDNGYGMFLNMLEYKQADRGHYLVKISRWYPSSQLCSHCGRRHKLSLRNRIYRCECGNVMDRDINAAINIKNEGLRILSESL